MFSCNILDKIFRHIDDYEKIELLENINNDINFKLRNVYKRKIFEFRPKYLTEVSRLSNKFNIKILA